MKDFSRTWKSSRNTRKQRKYRMNAPLNLRKNMMAAPLSKELRTKHKRRSISVRKGDRVMVLRGEFKKRTGKIEGVNTKKYRVFVEGIERTKRDGSKMKIGIPVSKVQITELNLDDKARKMIFEGRKAEK